VVPVSRVGVGPVGRPHFARDRSRGNRDHERHGRLEAFV